VSYISGLREVIGTDVRFNGTQGFVGAFPTYDDHGRMTLRPVSC
jgi:hypothetical protein